jgi:drug/metabolite transporter (DMT)-like permease
MLIRDANSGNLRPRHPYWTAFRTLATTLTGVSAYYAFSTLPLAQVYAILFATPLLITIFAIPILGETVRIRRWVAVLVGLGGVLVVLKPGAQDLTLGHAAALVAAFGSAFASIIVRKIGKDERSVVLLIFPMMSNFVVMGALLGFVYKPMPVEHMGGIALMSLMALLGSALVIAAYKAGEAVIVAPMQYSQIIWATLFGALLFNETIERATILGAVIIIGSGLYIVLREGRANASENTPVLRTRTRTETGTSLRIGLLIRARKKRE